MALNFGLLFLLACPALLAGSFLWTRLVTSRRFQRAVAGEQHSGKRTDEKPIPAIPYWTPLIGDGLFALLNPAEYVSGIL